MPGHKLRCITTNTERLMPFLEGAIVDKPAIEGCVDQLSLPKMLENLGPLLAVRF